MIEVGQSELAGYGRTCPHGHVVVADNCRVIGRRAVCVTCSSRWSTGTKERCKAEVQAAYGGKCECCGETEPDFLCLDHRDGRGNEHRRSLLGQNRGGGYRMYVLARREGFPDTYRLLCWNCNHGMTRPGGCPHQTRIEVFV